MRSKSQETTTAQSLGSLINSARDIMRKDKGLNGDFDRLPMLTWIMFLKFLDDLELQREEEAKLAGRKFQPAIDPPYSWRDWAANLRESAEMISFVNNEEAVLPDQTRGTGAICLSAELNWTQRCRSTRCDRDRFQRNDQSHD